MFFLLVIAMALAILPGSTAIRSFSEGCQAMDGQIFGEDIIGFYCYTEHTRYYDYMFSMIELKHCIGNSGGTLVADDDGHYQTTCDNCSLDSVRFGPYNTTCYLKCDCKDTHNTTKKSTLDLNKVLKDDNGRLVCFGHQGTRDRIPPECFHNEPCSTSVHLTSRALATGSAE